MRTVPAGSADGSRSARAASCAARIYGVTGEPATGRGEPDPAAVGLEQRRTDLLGQCGDLLRDGRGGHAEGLGDRMHRPLSRQGQQQLEAAYIHAVIVQQSRTICP